MSTQTTRSGRVYGVEAKRADAMSVDEVIGHVGAVLGAGEQEKGKMRRHWVYSAEGKSLIQVSISKNCWGLVLVHEDGRVEQGQYVKRHNLHHQHSAFDGVNFYWDACVVGHGRFEFMLGKSIAPYFTAVEPVQRFDGWHRRFWRHQGGVGADAVSDVTPVCDLSYGGQTVAGGAVGVMYDLSGVTWKQLPPPAGYPVVKRA